ncbi:polymer-forming cytoskeletal protein [Bifidobacterium magnum]|uniref:Polymer-forming cytoskeletal protein n=1 Tax=Bifidobacterium magnum TaxID=1692 RepID=A0A087BE92_9BIFI|nr:polymer-forming cytoskeletal protein [Bifidobacterium magnum]KFI69342.1 hypothetical protein BMAGN_1116 [Bifidobacterium magnum]
MRLENRSVGETLVRFIRRCAAMVALLTFALAGVAATGLAAGSAYATEDTSSQDSVTVTDSAGNVLGATENNNVAADMEVKHDLYWVGQNTTVERIRVGGDIIMAGQQVDVNNAYVGGSIRVAAQNIAVHDTTVNNNLTLAAQTITCEDISVDGALYAVAQTVSIVNGTYHGVGVAGDSVTINGTVNGDVSVDANKVVVGPDAKITGTLAVKSSNEPSVDASAQIGTLDFQREEKETGKPVLATVISAVAGIAGTIVFALALTWLLRRATESAVTMTRTHAGRIFGTGAIALIALPLLCILLICLTVTLPIAMAIIFGAVMLGFAAVPFAAAVFARILFPNMNRFASAAIGALVLGVAMIVPILGAVVGLAAFLFILGYVVQAIWAALRNHKRDAIATTPTAPATPVSSDPTGPNGMAYQQAPAGATYGYGAPYDGPSQQDAHRDPNA